MKNPIILASGSPRRQHILTRMNIEHDVVVPACIEPDRRPNETPEDYCKRTALLKAVSVAEHYPDRFVLSADTMVVLDGVVLGKPQSPADAFNMVGHLSGREHTVHTAMALIQPGGETVVEHCITRVIFRHLSNAEITWYTETGEGLDKAGAYGIQSAGGFLIKEIHGDWFNVVGLPVSVLLELLHCYCPGLWPPASDSTVW